MHESIQVQLSRKFFVHKPSGNVIRIGGGK